MEITIAGVSFLTLVTAWMALPAHAQSAPVKKGAQMNRPVLVLHSRTKADGAA